MAAQKEPGGPKRKGGAGNQSPAAWSCPQDPQLLRDTSVPGRKACEASTHGSSGGDWPAGATQWQPEALHVPDRPPTSIFFRFLASRMQTVSLPAVGT